MQAMSRRAAFHAIRIPLAWDSHDQSTLEIDPTWLARVKQVVDWCYARSGHRSRGRKSYLLLHFADFTSI